MANLALDLLEIEQGASDELSTIVRLSPDSLTLFLSLVSFAQNPKNWVLNEDDSTSEERRDILASKAANELMNNFVGMIFPVVWSVPIIGTLLCDGTTYNRADYPALYAVSAPTFILSADTFKVPDLRHKFVYGATNDIGSEGGEASHALTELEIPSHAHMIGGSSTGLVVAPGELPVMTPIALPTTTGYTGGGQSHNNMPPYGALVYVVLAT
jgi:microcystin-dependent protein